MLLPALTPQPLHLCNQLFPGKRSPEAFPAEELIGRYLNAPALAFSAIGAKIGDDFDQGGPFFIGLVRRNTGEVA